ncbi:MAG: hypothetical protein HY717_21870 [Planctomycetes bacterium]|nr:hypothetical protein [Planctomycetota bacterium]
MNPSPNQTDAPKTYKRKKKLIFPDIQLKIILGTLFVGVIGILINFQMGLLGLWAINQNASSTIEGTLEQIKGLFLKEFLVSLCILIPLSISVGVVYSFRFCGPLYRFRKFFMEFPEGRWDAAVSLRKGDQLHDLKDSINLTLNSLRDKICSQNEVLREVRKVFETAASPAGGSEPVERLKSLIDAEIRHFEAKLGKGAPAAPEGARPSAPVEEKILTPA